MSEFKTKWDWRIAGVKTGQDADELMKALNDGWQITKATPTHDSVQYILKRLKPEYAALAHQKLEERNTYIPEETE